MANLRRKISNSKTSSRQLSSRKSRTNSKLLDLKNIDLEEQKPKKSTKKSNSKTKPSSKKKEAKKEVKKAKLVAKKKEVKNSTKKAKKSDFVKNYSCVWRMETFENNLTNEKYRKRVWIVIGDGDKKYRKFDSQAEAISYFRSLKRRAEMKVQSISSKRFIRIVYTLFDMQQKGININEIKKNKNKIEPKINKNINNNDDVDFEDEYSRFDTVEFDNFNDEAEIDAALAKSLEYSVYIEDTNTNYIDTLQSAIDKYDDEEETIEVPQKDFSTELVIANEESDDDEEEDNHKTFYLKENNYKNEDDKTYTIEENPLKINSPTEIYSFTKDVNYLEPLQKQPENNNIEQLNEAIVVNNFENKQVIEQQNNIVEEPNKVEETQKPSLTELYAITKDMNLETKPTVSPSVNMDVEPVTVYEKPQELMEEENILKTSKQDTTTILKRVDNSRTKKVGKAIIVVISVIILLILFALIGYLVWELFFKGK